MTDDLLLPKSIADKRDDVIDCPGMYGASPEERLGVKIGFNAACALLKEDPKLLVELVPEVRELVESVKDIEEYLDGLTFTSTSLLDAADRVVVALKPWEGEN